MVKKRKFRFVGDPDEYFWDEKPIRDKVYSENELEVINAFNSYSADWVELTETEKPLHKDTDLGYFVGLAMQGLMANEHDEIVIMQPSHIAEWSIKCAKELIKQLENETSRH